MEFKSGHVVNYIQQDYDKYYPGTKVRLEREAKENADDEWYIIDDLDKNEKYGW